MRRTVQVRTRSRRLLTIACLAVPTGCGESTVTPLGAPQLLLSEIRLGGAERVAERIDTDVQFGQTVMEGIATGDSLWLEVARNLTFKSAAAEANFAIALASALPKNPDAVLTFVGRKSRVNDVCGIPFLKPTPEAVNAYYDSAASALARARAPSFASIALQCAAALDSARGRKLARVDPAYLVKNKPVPPKPVPRRRRASNRRR